MNEFQHRLDKAHQYRAKNPTHGGNIWQGFFSNDVRRWEPFCPGLWVPLRGVAFCNMWSLAGWFGRLQAAMDDAALPLCLAVTQLYTWAFVDCDESQESSLSSLFSIQSLAH